MFALARILMLGSLLCWSSAALANAPAAPQGAHDHGAHNHAAHNHGAHEAPGAPTAQPQPAADHGGHHTPTGAPPVNWTDFGYADKNDHGGKMGKGDAPMAPPLVLALLNFAIFAGILYWKAGPALSKYLANRHESIKNALEEAAKLQAEAKEKLAEYSTRIADADSEVNALIEQIRKDAESERERIVADAERQAEQMREDAEARIEQEFLAAKRLLEREVVAKAADVAEKLLTEKPMSADHNNLFKGFIADLKDQGSEQSTTGGLS